MITDFNMEGKIIHTEAYGRKGDSENSAWDEGRFRHDLELQE
jgi:hypothetical protein